jgi:hypothetical protein
MKALFLFIAFVSAVSLTGSAVLGQGTATQTDPGITALGVLGELKTINLTSKELTVKTDAGSVVTVIVADSTSYLRLPPGETTMDKATKIALTDLGEGDRVLARGKIAADHKSLPARTLVVMTKTDIAKKQERERMEWRQRGILGVISNVKTDTKEVTINTRSGMSTQPVIIPISDKVDMRRYAPDSIKFSDAKPSGFAELKIGDQVRALGDKSADGTHFTPEKVVTGAFRTVAGTVTAIDVTSGEIKINDLEKKQPLTVVIKSDSVLRKVPAEFGMMMGGRGPTGGQGAPGAGGPAPAGAQAPANRPPQGASGGAAPSGQSGKPNMQDMLDRLPMISTADLKVGDTIIVSSTKGADPTRLTAITLVSGADTLLAILAPRPQPGAAQAPNPAAGLGSGVTFGIGLP